MITSSYNGYLFKDRKEYQKLVKKIMESSTLYHYLSNNAYQSVKEYSKETFGKRVLEVYKKAIRNSRK